MIDEGYFHEVDDQYLEILHELHNDLQFHLKEWKSKKSERWNRIRYTHKKLKRSIKSWISFEKHVSLKPYIDLDNGLRKKAKYDFEKRFFSVDE